MIGPTSSFYDPNASAQGQRDPQSQYQQWIESFGGQQPQQHSRPQSMHQHSSQQARPTSYQQPQHVYRQEVVPSSDQYSYTQNQYSQGSHYVNSTVGVNTQPGVDTSTAPLSDSTSYQMQATRDPYAGYYSHSNPATGTNTPDPNMSHSASYATTPEPQYQPQQQTHHHTHVPSHSRSHSQNQAPSYASVPAPSLYTSQMLGIRSHSNNPHSTSSSLSSASNSWTEEVYSKAAPNITTTQDSTNVAAEPSTSASVNPKMPRPSASRPIGGKLRRQVHSQHRMVATAPAPTEPTPKASAKRKRTNPGSAPPMKLYRFEDSGSGSEDEDDGSENPFHSGGISVGMGGMGVDSAGTRTGRL
ncbi:hypothetical protein H0H92_000969 [Tricholoma furcatifolium]|nr:hypothetical protein H0H92_000969 [Tricholoma furcatifolium]